MEQYYGTGRRKRSVARVFIRPGSGKIEINNRDISEFFSRDIYKVIAQQPLKEAEQEGKFDIYATVKGGGTTGQAGAIRHGIARALLSYNEELRKPLKDAGLLTRDSREVERQKYGKKGARARYQFSKR